MSSIRNKLFETLHTAHTNKTHKKVTVVGAGQVGLACAFAIMNQGSCSELALVDIDEEKLKGEAMDLQHGSAHLKPCIVRASSDYKISENSDLVIVTAGARQRVGETRLDLVGRNLEIFKGIIPKLVQYSPNCSICVVSNPVDIMTYITAKLAGFPPGRVFGSGTALDSSRFRTLIAEKLQVDPRSVHGSILGEHGDSSVACFSTLNIAGVRLRDLSPNIGKDNDPDNFKTIHTEVIQAAYEIIKAKGYTNWAIGVTTASIAECVLRNERRIVPLSVPIKGKYGIQEDVYLSLPGILGMEGVSEIVEMPLDEEEVAQIRLSAQTIHNVQKELKF